MEQVALFNPDWDAQTLAEAAAISANPSRLAAASTAAARIKEEAIAKAVEMEKIQTDVYNHPSSVKAREDRSKTLTH